MIDPAIGAAWSFNVVHRSAGGRLRRSRLGSRIISRESFEVATADMELQLVQRETGSTPTVQGRVGIF
jgi:hypothetical protein